MLLSLKKRQTKKKREKKEKKEGGESKENITNTIHNNKIKITRKYISPWFTITSEDAISQLHWSWSCHTIIKTVHHHQDEATGLTHKKK